MGKRKKKTIPPELWAKWRENERFIDRAIARARSEQAIRVEPASDKRERP
jgi:hypothetical protein